jgi:hypothetical protein
MKTFYGLLAIWVMIIAVVLGSGCSQDSSQITPTQAQSENRALDDLEEVEERISDEQMGTLKPGNDAENRLAVKAGGLQFADANLLVSLNGTVESLSGVPIRLARWTQIEGPPATILSPLEPQTAILTPDVSRVTKLVFRLYGVDADDFTSSATATVMVQPLELAARVVSVAAIEADSVMRFHIRLQRPVVENLMLAYRTLDGTAINGEDYTGEEYRLLEFQAGENEKLIDIPLLQDESPEGPKYFELQVFDPNDSAGINVRGVGVILDPTNPSYPTTSPEINDVPDLDQRGLRGSQGI